MSNQWGVSFGYAAPVIDNCVVKNNSAWHGGGMGAQWSVPKVQNSRFENNTSSGYGGAIMLMNAYPSVYDSVFTGNHGGKGGAINAEYVAGIRIYRSVFENNTASYYGGALAGDFKSYIVAVNCVINDNSAPKGGGIYLRNSNNLTLVNSTVTRNSAPLGGGIAMGSSTTYYRVSNSIIYGNSTPSVFNAKYPAYSYVTYTDIEGGASGAGNIDADPLFVDPGAGDFQLSEGSPCIDAGTATGYYVPTDDINGTPRPQGAAYDMGAYEAPACDEVPTVEITSVSPEAIWPPNNKETDVVVSGTITAPEGCTITDASYSVVDEYGVYTEDGALSVADDGSFALLMTVEASRLGSDRDGRSYDVTISASDGAGDASASASAVVLHDMR